MIGGPPGQSFSIAGKKGGLADPRIWVRPPRGAAQRCVSALPLINQLLVGKREAALNWAPFPLKKSLYDALRRAAGGWAGSDAFHLPAAFGRPARGLPYGSFKARRRVHSSTV
jgi:hypothetical protein